MKFKNVTTFNIFKKEKDKLNSIMKYREMNKKSIAIKVSSNKGSVKLNVVGLFLNHVLFNSFYYIFTNKEETSIL